MHEQKLCIKHYPLEKTGLYSSIVVDDFKMAYNPILERLEAQLKAHIMSMLVCKKEIEYVFERPTFAEWLFKKPRRVKLILSVRDVRFNPSVFPSDETARLYTYDIL